MGRLQREPFYAAVYRLVRQVPSGRVTTYGAIARALGAPHWARQVGWAMAALPGADDDVPAHRVVLASGALSAGFASGVPGVQRGLLEHEGIEFDAHDCVPLDTYFWQPSEPADDIRPAAPAGERAAAAGHAPGSTRVGAAGHRRSRSAP